MIPIEEYSKSSGISEDKLVSMIREGFYAGRLVDGRWYVIRDNELPASENSSKERRKNRGPFLKGAIFGISLSILIGLFSYPWDRPYFEGAAGYHLVFMVFLTPILTIGFGGFSWVISKIKNKLRK